MLAMDPDDTGHNPAPGRRCARAAPPICRFKSPDRASLRPVLICFVHAFGSTMKEGLNMPEMQNCVVRLPYAVRQEYAQRPNALPLSWHGHRLVLDS